MVPKRQLMILNFDEWTASDEAAQASMGDVAQFLQLSHFEFRVSEAHNTHANRSVGATHQRPGTYSGRLPCCTLAAASPHALRATSPLRLPVQLSHPHAKSRWLGLTGLIARTQHQRVTRRRSNPSCRSLHDATILPCSLTRTPYPGACGQGRRLGRGCHQSAGC